MATDQLKSIIYRRGTPPEPKGFNSKIPWTVQHQIAVTTGKVFNSIVGNMTEYPTYSIPLPKTATPKLMLDIGSGWGRWLVAGHDLGYIPVGFDIRLEFCETQQHILKATNRKGYSIVADLEEIPFVDSLFDLVWSFITLQQVHKNRLENCLKCVDKLLAKDGFSYLQFPNKMGIRHRFWKSNTDGNGPDDFLTNRMYTPEEYREIFTKYLDNFEIYNHCFIGISMLKEDLKYLSFPQNAMWLLSLLATNVTKPFPLFAPLADSIFIKNTKKSSLPEETLLRTEFIKLHQSGDFDNLNIIRLAKCPISGERLELSNDRTKVISNGAGVYFPVVNDIPILIRSEAVSL
jgi:ubiquinone/menaquinone biosynthesis C-methylase UbiE/uncharacterized protein YbaR (Trm112 family)